MSFSSDFPKSGLVVIECHRCKALYSEYIVSSEEEECLECDELCICGAHKDTCKTI